MKIMFEGTIATGKTHGPQVVKYQRKALKVLGTPLTEKNLLIPNVSPSWMLTQWMLNAHYC